MTAESGSEIVGRAVHLPAREGGSSAVATISLSWDWDVSTLPPWAVPATTQVRPCRPPMEYHRIWLLVSSSTSLWDLSETHWRWANLCTPGWPQHCLLGFRTWIISIHFGCWGPSRSHDHLWCVLFARRTSIPLCGLSGESTKSSGSDDWPCSSGSVGGNGDPWAGLDWNADAASASADGKGVRRATINAAWLRAGRAGLTVGGCWLGDALRSSDGVRDKLVADGPLIKPITAGWVCDIPAAKTKWSSLLLRPRLQGTKYVWQIPVSTRKNVKWLEDPSLNTIGCCLCVQCLSQSLSLFTYKNCSLWS